MLCLMHMKQLMTFYVTVAIVALMIPILVDYARRKGLSPKQLLLPLSYACKCLG